MLVVVRTIPINEDWRNNLQYIVDRIPLNEQQHFNKTFKLNEKLVLELIKNNFIKTKSLYIAWNSLTKDSQNKIKDLYPEYYI